MGLNMIQMEKRHIFVIVAHFAWFFAYGHRFNISVAMVAMVGKNNLHHETTTHRECPQRNSSELENKPTVEIKKGEFDWNEKEQGLLLSGFFHGYLLTLLLGGVVLSKWSAKSIFGGGIFLSSVLTLLTPVAARTHFYVLYVVRFLIGKECRKCSISTEAFSSSN